MSLYPLIKENLMIGADVMSLRVRTLNKVTQVFSVISRKLSVIKADLLEYLMPKLLFVGAACLFTNSDWSIEIYCDKERSGRFFLYRLFISCTDNSPRVIKDICKNVYLIKSNEMACGDLNEFDCILQRFLKEKIDSIVYSKQTSSTTH